MLRKPLLELIYESAHMQRWNDHIRPKGFTELDKQGHKMIIAYMLAKFEEDEREAKIDWCGLIEGGIFEFFHRIVLTDIKPSVAHELMAKHGARLNDWIMEQLRPQLECLGEAFSEKFRIYLDEPQYCKQEKKLLKAAHYLATNWEFQIIRNLNADIFGLEETKRRIENEIEEYYDLLGVRKAGLGKKTSQFINLVGQLRFQQRWAQSPRVPETSVMGHMLVVALLSYLLSAQTGACEQRLCNNFFAGLLHDLPEVLTRDIVSPVKRSVAGLEELIKEIETRQIHETVLPLLPEGWHEQILYFIEDEFADKIRSDGDVVKVSWEDIDRLYNHDRYSPVDGSLLKGCDHLAAYIEARISLAHGITSRHLREASENLYRTYQNRRIGESTLDKCSTISSERRERGERTMLKLQRLSECTLDMAVQTWNHGFQDYFVPVRLSTAAFVDRLSGERLSPDHSIVAIGKNEGAGLLLNGIEEIAGCKTAWNGGTAVLPAWRSQGVGRKLLVEALQIYEEEGVERATLEVIQENERAIKLYQSFGYERQAELICWERKTPWQGDAPSLPQGMKLRRGSPRDLAILAWYDEDLPWQSHWSHIKDAESWLAEEDGQIVGYVIYGRQWDRQGRLHGMNIYQCQALPGHDRKGQILRCLLQRSLGAGAGAGRLLALNFSGGERTGIGKLLVEHGFAVYVRQWWMVKE